MGLMLIPSWQHFLVHKYLWFTNSQSSSTPSLPLSGQAAYLHHGVLELEKQTTLFKLFPNKRRGKTCSFGMYNSLLIRKKSSILWLMECLKTDLKSKVFRVYTTDLSYKHLQLSRNSRRTSYTQVLLKSFVLDLSNANREPSPSTPTPPSTCTRFLLQEVELMSKLI